MPLDTIKTILNGSEFAESFAYTVIDLDGAPPGDNTTTITGLFDPALDVEDDSVIETGIEVLIANGEISRITMATAAPTGVFVQGETITGDVAGGTATYAGQASGILYFRPLAGGFSLSETITGSTSGASWGTHLSAPNVTVEGISTPKAGDRFVARGYNWQVDAVENRRVAGSHLLGAQRGAIVPA